MRPRKFDYDKIADSIYSNPRLRSVEKRVGATMTSGREFWWLHGYTTGGKPVVLGPANTENEITERGEDLCDVQTFCLNTRSQPKATREIREKLHEQGMSADEALERKLHEKGYARAQQSTKEV